MKKFPPLPIIIAFALLLAGKIYPIAASAPIGNYLILSGGHVTAASSSASLSSKFSFKALINPNSVSGKQIILSIGDKNSGKTYYEIGINGGLLAVDYDYNGSHSSVNAGNLSAGLWQEIDVEITLSQTRLYIDQKLVFAPFSNNNLGPIGPDIVLGDSYKESFFDSKPFKGLMDEVQISGDSKILLWHLDEGRGVMVASDSSGNNINGILVGGDNLIHFFGVIPSPTPMPTMSFDLPPISWTRPVLPTLSFPFPVNPPPPGSGNPPPANPTPTTYDRLSIPDRIRTRPGLPIITSSIQIPYSSCPGFGGQICAN